MHCTRSFIVLSALSFFLVACSFSNDGVIKASIVDNKGNTREPLTINFYKGYFDSATSLIVVMPSGEIYKGKAVSIRSEPNKSVVNSVLTGGDPSPIFSQTASLLFGDENAAGMLEAILFSNNNHSMRCLFREADPGNGLGSGGLGECQTSDGNHLIAQF